MNSFWSQIPFLRLLLPFLAGILVQTYIQSNSYKTIIGALLFAVLGLVIYSSNKVKIKYRYSWTYGLIFYPCFFMLGVFLVYINTAVNISSHVSKYKNLGAYVVRLSEPTLEKQNSIKVLVDISSAKTETEWKNVSGKLMLYLKKDSNSLKLKYGDEILIRTKIDTIKPPQNPGEFDYKQYLYFHNVYHQGYTSSENWISMGTNSGNSIIGLFYDLRDYLLNILSENGLKGDEYAVASALILGYEDKLDADVISAYSTTGALHVLSVSGLHVGIIYFVFNYLFSLLMPGKRLRFFKMISLLLLLWFYAGLTGFSPSVLRATTMFSFIVVAQLFNFYTNIFNTLAASCFMLLLYNPFLVMEVGFQLSFLAVWGIVFIQPKLYDLWKAPNIILDKIWAVTAVSIAAQLATFPLGLLYFHQFPNLFLVSNLIVIPVSTVVLYAGIVLFIVSGIDFAAYWVSKLLHYTVLFLNESVKFMDRLPGALLDGISISIFESWLIYGMVLSGIYFFVNKTKNYFFLFLTLIIIVLAMQVGENYMEHKQSKIVFYSCPKSTAIDFISGKKNVFVADTVLLNNKSRMLFHVKHNWWNLGLSNTIKCALDAATTINTDHLLVRNNFYFFNNTTVLLLDSAPAFENMEDIKVDYLVVKNNFVMPKEKLDSTFNYAKIVVDGSNSNKSVKYWKKQFVNSPDKIYLLSEKGALEVNCNEF
jgi:competence protein ComEC